MKHLIFSRRAKAFIPVVACCFSVAGFSRFAVAQPEKAKTASTGSAKSGSAKSGSAKATKGAKAATNAEVAAITKEVLREASELRELPIRRPVQSGAQPRSTIERMVTRELDKSMSRNEMHASELALRKLGMVPPGFRLRSFYVALMTEQVAGYYDPRARRLFLADWIDVGAQRVVAVHELTHALQDQHFNLRRFEKWPRGESDSRLAVAALIEGDATLAMGQYIARNPLRMVPLLKTAVTGMGPTAKYNAAPRALRESLIFPYEQGMDWAAKVYGRGGWKLLSKAFRDLPQSTEQILHADKYFRRDKPVRVVLPDVSKGLGRGWKRVEQDVNGEWGLYLVLDEYLKNKAESQRAAAGWGGDRYAVYEGPKGQVMLAQMTVWDSEKEAWEFFLAYSKRTTLRYKVEEHSLEAETRLTPERIVNRQWHTKEGRVLLKIRGRRVLILEGAPGDNRLPKLSRALWK